MKKIITLIAAFCLALVWSACGTGETLDPKNPVALTLRHDFDGGMRQAIDSLVSEFNAAVGREHGVVVTVEAGASGGNPQNAMSMIASGDSGAPAMPDIAVVYPKTAAQLRAKGLLANLDGCFIGNELAAYVPAFVDGGRVDGGLYVFPFAISTELLFVNQTFFDRFAADTGVTMDCFKTFEGIADAAVKYYEWTNVRTPDIPRDHKQFFSADSWLNAALAAMVQQGKNLFEHETLALDTPGYRLVWETFYAPAVSGGFVTYDGNPAGLAKTGDIICAAASSSDVFFYGGSAGYANGRAEQVEYSVLPYPVFSGGKKAAIWRGAGFVVAKSGKKRETAAALFLKWFTAPEQNTRFAAETGCLPVTKEAFETTMPERIAAEENPQVRRMLEALTTMYAEYDFFAPPAFEQFDIIAQNYDRRYKERVIKDRETYLNGGGMNSDEALAVFAAELRQ